MHDGGDAGKDLVQTIACSGAPKAMHQSSLIDFTLMQPEKPLTRTQVNSFIEYLMEIGWALNAVST